MTDKKYESIIDLDAPQSERHARMPREARAAQFAPFAALSGFGDAIAEEARITEREIALSNGERERVNRWWRLLLLVADAEPAVKVTYFVPDRLKSGGCYRTLSGCVEYISDSRALMRIGGEEIPLGNILRIDSHLYRDMVEGE